MNDIKTIQHDLKRDVHNLLTLLKFIKEENEVKDPEIKRMLELALNRETHIHDSLHHIDSIVRRQK